MEEYLYGKDYKKLYKRFYDGRSPDELIDFAGSVKDKIVLDACGGDGRMSLAAIKHGAKKVFLIDKERKMTLGSKIHIEPMIEIQISSIETFLEWHPRRINHIVFDYAFCQQAINYWLNKETAKGMADNLSEGGIFVFNTFNRKPSKKPAVKEYTIDGNLFIETSWLVKNIVHHVQIRDGMPPHATSFYWLSPEYLMEILTPYFSVTVKKERGASLYRCVKK